MNINWGLLIVFVLLCNLFGSIGSFWAGGDSTWYRDLKKPNFNPPSWIFGPVWTLLFSLMGIALYFIWQSPISNLRTIALIIFGIQFLFNIFWSFLFFGINNPFYAFIDILVLMILIVFSIVYFFLVNKTSGYLLIPYFLWVSFASVLNYFIWKLNV